MIAAPCVSCFFPEPVSELRESYVFTPLAVYEDRRIGLRKPVLRLGDWLHVLRHLDFHGCKDWKLLIVCNVPSLQPFLVAPCGQIMESIFLPLQHWLPFLILMLCSSIYTINSSHQKQSAWFNCKKYQRLIFNDNWITHNAMLQITTLDSVSNATLFPSLTTISLPPPFLA